ncbi:hypothetical protein C8R44DRAFT_745812 [Mycena epipterygia]|nr:hypothetical protein C8R44DRAFT_745812 [Mycena epipterygia]
MPLAAGVVAAPAATRAPSVVCVAPSAAPSVVCAAPGVSVVVGVGGLSRGDAVGEGIFSVYRVCPDEPPLGVSPDKVHSIGGAKVADIKRGRANVPASRKRPLARAFSAKVRQGGAVPPVGVGLARKRASASSVSEDSGAHWTGDGGREDIAVEDFELPDWVGCRVHMHDGGAKDAAQGGGFPLYLVTQGREDGGEGPNHGLPGRRATGTPFSGSLRAGMAAALHSRGSSAPSGSCTRSPRNYTVGDSDPRERRGASGGTCPAGSFVDHADDHYRQAHCMPRVPGRGSETTRMSSSVSTSSSVTACSWVEVPAVARYYSIWQGGIIYTERVDAKAEFQSLEAEGGKPRLLSTESYDEAQAFAEGVHWLSD